MECWFASPFTGIRLKKMGTDSTTDSEIEATLGDENLRRLREHGAYKEYLKVYSRGCNGQISGWSQTKAGLPVPIATTLFSMVNTSRSLGRTDGICTIHLRSIEDGRLSLELDFSTGCIGTLPELKFDEVVLCDEYAFGVLLRTHLQNCGEQYRVVYNTELDEFVADLSRFLGGILNNTLAKFSRIKLSGIKMAYHFVSAKSFEGSKNFVVVNKGGTEGEYVVSYIICDV